MLRARLAEWMIGESPPLLIQVLLPVLGELTGILLLNSWQRLTHDGNCLADRSRTASDGGNQSSVRAPPRQAREPHTHADAEQLFTQAGDLGCSET